MKKFIFLAVFGLLLRILFNIFAASIKAQIAVSQLNDDIFINSLSRMIVRDDIFIIPWFFIIVGLLGAFIMALKPSEKENK